MTQVDPAATLRDSTTGIAALQESTGWHAPGDASARDPQARPVGVPRGTPPDAPPPSYAHTYFLTKIIQKTYEQSKILADVSKK